MARQVLFLDFENLQLNEAEICKRINDDTEIYLFHGVHQNNFPAFWIDVASKLGEKIHRVQLKESASNALDFFIAYYIGALSNKSKNYKFRIVSNDKGYDPLIDHLKEEGVDIGRLSRQTNQGQSKTPKTTIVMSSANIAEDLYNRAYKILACSAYPPKIDSLKRILQYNLLKGHKNGDALLTQLLEDLQDRNVISIKDEIVTYSKELLKICTSPRMAKFQTQYNAVYQALKKIKLEKRPSKVESLKNSVVSWSKDTHRENTDGIITRLENSGFLVVDRAKNVVRYL